MHKTDKAMQQQTPVIEVAPFAPSALDASALSGAWQIGGWQDIAEATKPALAVLGFAAIGDDYGIIRQSKGAECYQIAPDKLWLRAGNAEVLSPALAIIRADDRLTITDISHSRMTITITGNGAESLITRTAAADIAQLQTGAFVQTTINGISVLISRIANQSFAIHTPTTWHQSIRDYLLTNSRVPAKK